MFTCNTAMASKLQVLILCFEGQSCFLFSSKLVTPTLCSGMRRWGLSCLCRSNREVFDVLICSVKILLVRYENVAGQVRLWRPAPVSVISEKNCPHCSFLLQMQPLDFTPQIPLSPLRMALTSSLLFSLSPSSPPSALYTQQEGCRRGLKSLWSG